MDQSDQFTVDQGYILRQLQIDNQNLNTELTVTKAGFQQITDMHTQRVAQINSLEAEVQRLRTEMGEHEKLAVDQQMKLDEYMVRVKRFGFSTFEAFAEEFDRMTNPRLAEIRLDKRTESVMTPFTPANEEGPRIWADDPASE
jgi:hypothetical protein